MNDTINTTAVTPLWGSPEDNVRETVRFILLGVAYTVNLFFGLPINCYILWLIARGRQEKIASDFIPLNQIVVEILLCFSAILYILKRTLSLRVLTDLSSYFTSLFIFMRPLVQSYICLEQYLATVHPVLFLRCKPLRYKIACCCVSWLIAITLCIATKISYFRREFLFMLTALYLYFLLLMVFCCFSVLRALKRPAPGEGQRNQQRGNSMKKKACKIIFITMAYNVMFQLPMAIVTAFIGTIPTPDFLIATSVNACIFVITGFVPPVMYLYRVGKLASTCNCL